MRRIRFVSLVRTSVASWALVASSAPVTAQVTQRVSLASDGTQANGPSNLGFRPLAGSGRYVAFSSEASNLDPNDTGSWADIFVRDRLLGTIERVSTNSAGIGGDSYSYDAAISEDGRFVAFLSEATNLVPGDANGVQDVFVKDRQTGEMERISVSTAGTEANAYSFVCLISPDGRYVLFGSDASNLVPQDTNGASDIFLRDRMLQTTERVSVGSTGAEGDDESTFASMSPDARFIVFTSRAGNLVAGDTNQTYDVFLRDRWLATTERVSVSSTGMPENSYSFADSVTPDGRYVLFWSYASNLVPGDTNGKPDVFLRDRRRATTERVSLRWDGGQVNGESISLGISDDARYVAFTTKAPFVVQGDTNGAYDVFLRDRQLGTNERVSVGSAGEQANGLTRSAVMSADARFVTFSTTADDLVYGDTNGYEDVFVRDRLGGPSFTSLCDPGARGVMSCPCANPPAGSGRGCDNSSGTEGASLAAAGGTYLSSDSLAFRTNGEKPTATSVLLQGTAAAAGGTIYGQGISCVGGTLTRLFTKSASDGSITAPDFAAGDPTVSARSAAKGNPISAGDSRWYLVFYRDPMVLGGCSAGSTFNATQTGLVTWSP